MSTPHVSVIIPTYNRRGVVERALQSVFAQTYGDFEVLVVDDGSTDGTRSVVEGRSGVRYLFQENAGPATARNVGIRHALGDIIAFLDSDDVWWPEFLKTQVGVLGLYPEVALVCARSVVGRKAAKPFPLGQELFVGDFYGKLYTESFVRTPATAVRRSCLEVVGYFNEAYPWSEDHDLWLRIASRYNIAYVNRCLVTIGRQGDNISRNLARPLDEHLKVALEVLEKNYDPSRIPEAVYRDRIATRYLQFSRLFFMLGETAQAWSHIWRALRMTPYSLRAYRYVLKGVFRSLPGARLGAGFLEPVRAKSYPEVDRRLAGALSSRARARAPAPARKEKPCSVLTVRSSTFIRRRWSLLLRIVSMLVAMVRRDSGSGAGTGTGRGTEEETARESRDSPA